MTELSARAGSQRIKCDSFPYFLLVIDGKFAWNSNYRTGGRRMIMEYLEGGETKWKAFDVKFVVKTGDGGEPTHVAFYVDVSGFKHLGQQPYLDKKLPSWLPEAVPDAS